MKIILTKEDIETLIKDTYQGVENIEMDDIEITIKLNSSILKHQTIAPIVTPVSVAVPVSLKEQNMQEVKQGIMASGGKDRTMKRF